ncbi:MAG: VanZ family protein [Bacteroidota bacterium]
MLKKRLFTLLFIGWLAGITVISLFPLPDQDIDTNWIPHADKIAHATFHFFLVFFGVIGLQEQGWGTGVLFKKVKLLWWVALGYGICIEALQWIMPFARSADFWDLLANVTGATLSGWLIQRYRSRIRGLN